MNHYNIFIPRFIIVLQIRFCIICHDPDPLPFGQVPNPDSFIEIWPGSDPDLNKRKAGSGAESV